MAKSPPSFSLYPGDLIKSCVDMSVCEFGAYMRLLCYQWEHGAIPAAKDRMARICGMDRADFDVAWTGIGDRFDDVKGENLKGKLKVQSRLAEQRERDIETWQARKAGGRKGGRPSERASEILGSRKPQGLGEGSPEKTSTEKGEGKRETNKKKKESFDPTDLPLPFSSEPFAEAWGAFCKMRREIGKPFRETGAEATLKMLSKKGEPLAIAALEISTANEWQGIREPDPPRGVPRPGPGNGGQTFAQQRTANTKDAIERFVERRA